MPLLPISSPIPYQNTTISAFGDPHTRIALYDHWIVLLRPRQVTLGSLVLITRHDCSALSALPHPAFLELQEVILAIETLLKRFFHYDKLNYLMLMMVDPHVHWHIIPRYAHPRCAPIALSQTQWLDHAWPKPPDLSQHYQLTSTDVIDFASFLRERWPTLPS